MLKSVVEPGRLRLMGSLEAWELSSVGSLQIQSRWEAQEAEVGRKARKAEVDGKPEGEISIEIQKPGKLTKLESLGKLKRLMSVAVNGNSR